MKPVRFCFLAIFSQITSGCLVPAYSLEIETNQSVAAIAEHLEGIMDTSAQAIANPKKARVRMTTCRVELAKSIDPDTIYLYQEQALAASLDTPYRQRFVALSSVPHNSEAVISRSYKPLEPKTQIGLCDRPDSERIISQKALGKFVCTVFLKPLLTVYIGQTQPGGCPSNYRGAVKITNQIILHDRGMDTWDRGFDASGNQIWGAREDGYEFRWIKPKSN
jgi:hypothetical protein